MNLLRLGSVFGISLMMGVALFACGEDEQPMDALDAGSLDARAPDGESKESGPDDSGSSDTGTDTGRWDGGADADADASSREPGLIDDLAATADTHTRVTLTWT